MDSQMNENTVDEVVQEEEVVQSEPGKYDKIIAETNLTHLTGMYKNWFLDYASYVILDRAVPHIDDGLKPVQRRILHAMKVVDDGRFNKVANIVGQTMRLNPHGDAAIYETMVRLSRGNEVLLHPYVDSKGNFGKVYSRIWRMPPHVIRRRSSAASARSCSATSTRTPSI